jgi:hypothetical protein
MQNNDFDAWYTICCLLHYFNCIQLVIFNTDIAFGYIQCFHKSLKSINYIFRIL